MTLFSVAEQTVQWEQSARRKCVNISITCVSCQKISILKLFNDSVSSIKNARCVPIRFSLQVFNLIIIPCPSPSQSLKGTRSGCFLDVLCVQPLAWAHYHTKLYLSLLLICWTINFFYVLEYQWECRNIFERQVNFSYLKKCTCPILWPHLLLGNQLALYFLHTLDVYMLMLKELQIF